MKVRLRFVGRHANCFRVIASAVRSRRYGADMSPASATAWAASISSRTANRFGAAYLRMISASSCAVGTAEPRVTVRTISRLCSLAT